MARDFFHTGLQIGRNDALNAIAAKGPGNHWYVDYRNGSDGGHSNDGKSWDSAFKTLSRAHTAAVSNNNDFIHNMRICLKELRETYRWLKVIRKLKLISYVDKANNVLGETEELIKIFVTSIKTAGHRKK